MPSVNRQYFEQAKPKLVKHDLDADNFVFLRPMSASQLLALHKQFGNGDLEDLDFLSTMIATCVCDEHGQPLFHDQADVRQSFNLPFSDLVELGKQCCEVSGIPTLEKKD